MYTCYKLQLTSWVIAPTKLVISVKTKDVGASRLISRQAAGKFNVVDVLYNLRPLLPLKSQPHDMGKLFISIKELWIKITIYVINFFK